MSFLGRLWVRPSPTLSYEKAYLFALRDNDPSQLDRWPQSARLTGFAQWLLNNRHTAWRHFCNFPSTVYGDFRLFYWDGDWLLYWPQLRADDVPADAKKWFWSPAACPDRVYMYLRSHPEKLAALYNKPADS